MPLRVPVLAALALLTLLGYFQFPGHTYLQSDTLIYVPILEHLKDPSVLAGDIVATKPHVSYTIYDEVTLALQRFTGLDFQWVLEGQQLLFRFLGACGLFLIVSALGLSPRMALLVTGALELGATIGGPAVLSIEYEPVPRGFAVPLILLAVGLLAHRQYLAAGFATGAALLYHPPTVLPLLAAIAVLVILPSGERKQRLAMLWPVGVAFVLLLVAARLQTGVSERQILFGHIDTALERLQRFRGAYNWVSLWPAHWFAQYAILAAVAVCAMARLGRELREPVGVPLVAMPIYGLLAIPASYVVLETMRWSLMPQLQPARAALFFTVFTLLLAAVAGVKAATRGAIAEAVLWFVPVFLIPANARVWPDLSEPMLARRAVIVLVLAALAAAAAWSGTRRHGWTAWCAALVLPFFLIPGWGGLQNYPELHSAELDELSAWARSGTARDSVFLFPEAGRGLQPSVFRARALRAVYVDWKSGGQVNLLKDFAEEWWRRWQETMQDGAKVDFALYSRLGIDYVVVRAEQRLEGRAAEYTNSAYAAYRVGPRQ
ncbi:MAG: DUF6798 domain-containing protein [Bryobacteraceae bacterium]